MAEKKKKKKQPEEILNRDIVIRRINHRRRQANRQSPLVRLKEIFEEQRIDKDRFVGDTMFWKYFEDIDPDRVKDTESVEYKNLRIMCAETIFYIILLVVFTCYCYQLQSPVVYEYRNEQINYWSGCDAGGDCKLLKVNDRDSFWKWMKHDFMDLAFTEYEQEPTPVARITTGFQDNDLKLTLSPRFVGPTQSGVLLGTIRFRQLRVNKNTGCMVSKLFGHVFPDCYAAFDGTTSSHEYFGQRFLPTYLMPVYNHTPAMATRQVPQSGNMATYGAGGYMVDLPFNKVATRYMLDDLHKYDWIDQATRAIQLEFTVLNTNINAICNSRILFEFGPTGSVLTTQQAQSSLVLFFTPTFNGQGLGVMIMSILTLLLFGVYSMFVGWLWVKTCRNFLGNSICKWFCTTLVTNPLRVVMVLGRTFYHYVEYGWNLMDVLILFLWYVHVGFRIRTYLDVSFQPEMSPEVIGHPEMFMPFSRAITSQESCIISLSFLAIAAWVKLFKYLCLISYFRILVRILERCGHALVVFSLLLVVIFFGFSVAFFVGLGGNEMNYSSLPGSFLILFFKLVDGYEINPDWFSPGRLQFMPIMFFCYIGIVYFVLLNVFLAIVMDVYATSKSLIQSEKHVSQKENPMLVFLKNFYQWSIEGVALKDLDRDDTDLDHLPSDLMTIKLELLPGLVRRKFIEKKIKMQKVASDNFANLELFAPGEAPMLDDQPQQASDWMLPSSDKIRDEMRTLDDTRFTVDLQVLSFDKGLKPPSINYDKSNQAFEIHDVPRGGAFHRWNQAHPRDKVVQHDYITQVNDEPVNFNTNFMEWVSEGGWLTLTIERKARAKPPSFYHVHASSLAQEVSHDQLQRLMNEDETLPLLLGSSKAVQVIAKFKRQAGEVLVQDATQPAADGTYKILKQGAKKYVSKTGSVLWYFQGTWQINIEGKMDYCDYLCQGDDSQKSPPDGEWRAADGRGSCFVKDSQGFSEWENRFMDRDHHQDAVKNLQFEAFSKLDGLEKMKPDEEVPKVPEVDIMTKQMSEALTEVRNLFRQRLTWIIEAIANLFEHLVDLTKQIEVARDHHLVLLDAYFEQTTGVRRKRDTMAGQDTLN